MTAFDCITHIDDGYPCCFLRNETMKHTYPLWCVDNGDASSECRYSGPYDTEDEAADYLLDAERGSVRKCRAISAAGLLNTEDIIAFFDELEGHGKQWADWEEPLVEARSTAAAALKVFLDEQLKMLVYVCEGDE